MKFYIFRHAETFPSKNMGGIYDKDNYTTPILYEGKDTTIHLANYLKEIPSDLNVSSPYERCKETVKMISRISGKEFVLDERIGEFYQIEYKEFKERIKDFLKDVRDKDYQNIVICTHGAAMSLLVHLISDREPEENIPISEFKKTGVLIKVENKNFQEIDFNI